jgi:dephospho-CoA kinase
MRLLGITGGIGAGKTLVCKVFESLGIPIFNSDIAAKELMNDSIDLKKKIIYLLGEKAYNLDNLNRAYVAQSVFNDKEKLLALNHLVHPLVREMFKDWVKNNHTKPYVLNEAALLIESGSYRDLDEVIYINAPERIRIKRVMLRDNCNETDVRLRIKNQWSDGEKVKHCKWVINNDNSEMLLPQILKIHKEIISD